MFLTRPDDRPDAPGVEALPSAEALYDQHFDFVWRNARRLGVKEEDLDDVVQDVFIVVHRRAAEFEARSSVQTWLFGILQRTVQHYRRSKARRLTKLEALVSFGDAMSPAPPAEPLELLTRREQAGVLHAMLQELDDDKRAVLILVELEQRSVPEVADALKVNVNTVYSRLRAARQEMERAVEKMQAREKRAAVQ